jgi:hypothetical protein
MRWFDADRSSPKWKLIELLNQQTAQEYQRLENRLRQGLDPEADELSFSSDDQRFLRRHLISPA